MYEDVEPIKPSEVTQYIPNWVIKATNECIKNHFIESNRESKFTQDELVEYCLQYAPKDKEITKDMLFNKHWLDIETKYRKNGWIVTYDKPAYDEHYKPIFTFKVPKQ